MNCKPLLGLAAVAFCTHAAAQITFYEADHFRGRTFATSQAVSNFKSAGFNDQGVVGRGRARALGSLRRRQISRPLRRAASRQLRLAAQHGPREPDLVGASGPERQAIRERAQPVLDAPYEYRRRPNERLSRAPVTSVRAVVGPPEQRCWVERQQVAEPQRDYNVPGALVGGVIGGILGHQIGGGTGKDIATIGGVVGGAAIGANVNSRTSTQYSTRDVRRCEAAAASGPPQYYDVTYEFRGVEHRVQMASPPGRTVTVNYYNGEPRTI
jgi:uncharacterized protein YcfJ